MQRERLTLRNFDLTKEPEPAAQKQPVTVDRNALAQEAAAPIAAALVDALAPEVVDDLVAVLEHAKANGAITQLAVELLRLLQAHQMEEKGTPTA